MPQSPQPVQARKQKVNQSSPGSLATAATLTIIIKRLRLLPKSCDRQSVFEINIAIKSEGG